MQAHLPIKHSASYYPIKFVYYMCRLMLTFSAANEGPLCSHFREGYAERILFLCTTVKWSISLQPKI